MTYDLPNKLASCRWLKGNDIETGSTTGSNYWAAYVGGAKIKTDGLKPQTRTDAITH